jgi:hypothetical protein
MNSQEKTHRIVKYILIAYVLVSPFDVIPPLRWLIPQLSAEWVDILQLPLLGFGFLLLWRERQRVKLPLWGAEFLIILGSVLALTRAANFAEGIETLLKDIYMYLFFFMLVNLIKEMRFLERLIKYWQISAVVQAAIIVVSLFINIGKPIRGFRGVDIDISSLNGGIQEKHLIKRQVLREQGIFAPGRQRGTLPNSNLAGLYLAQASILTIGMPFVKRRWAQGLMVAGMVIALLGTGSNSSLGAFLGAFVVYVLFHKRNTNWMMWLGSGVIGLGIVVGVTSIVPPQKIASELSKVSPIFEQGVSRAPDSFESRTAMVRSGWQQFVEQPIGLAPHGMRETTEERNVHNDYAAYLFERGYLGFLGLLFLMGGAATYAIYSGFHGDDLHRRRMATLLALLVVTMISELVHEYMREREVWMGMAMIILYAEFALRNHQIEKHQAQQKRWPWAFHKRTLETWQP